MPERGPERPMPPVAGSQPLSMGADTAGMTGISTVVGIGRSMAVAAVLVLALAGCSGSDLPAGTDPVSDVSPVITVPPTIGPTGCEPGSPAERVSEGLEVQGTIDVPGEELWALFDIDGPITWQEPIPVYWRIGGDRSLRITLIGPNDRVAPVPAPMPKPHETWERPGEPWMGTITFPQPGCWRIFVERAKRQGDMWVDVV